MLPVMGLVTPVLVVLTAESGEWLEDRVRQSALVGEHAERGPGPTPWAIALFVLTVAVWLLGRADLRWERDRGGEAGGPTDGGASAVARSASSVLVRVVALAIALAVAVGATVQVYRISDSGAKAARQGRFSTSGSGAGW
ncbi:hypothetical protein ACIRP2_21075 [Streptomyces sp. NPDC101194]|uniref:hypothetical protein n=1 Tax=Streptomyces sp. NPDC101194 TaxID=3366127 RepID=UPI0037F41BD3